MISEEKKGERRDGYDKDFFRVILYKYKYNIIYWIILNKKPKRNIVGKQRYSQNKNKSYEKVKVMTRFKNWSFYLNFFEWKNEKKKKW